jgi:hypothetical protein
MFVTRCCLLELRLMLVFVVCSIFSCFLGSHSFRSGNTAFDMWVWQWDNWTSKCVWGTTHINRPQRLRWLLQRERYKLLHIGNILAELVQAEQKEYILGSINILVLCEIIKKYPNSGRAQSLYVLTSVTKQTLHHNSCTVQ